MDRAVKSIFVESHCFAAATPRQRMIDYGVLTTRKVGDRHCCVMPNYLRHEAGSVHGDIPSVMACEWYTSVQHEGRIVPVLCDMGPDRADAQIGQ